MFGKFDITFCLNASMCPRGLECGRNIDNYTGEEKPPFISVAMFIEDTPVNCKGFFEMEKENA